MTIDIYDRYKLVLKLRRKGLTYREIGEEIDVCTSRARQICIQAWITIKEFKTKKAWLKHQLTIWR